MCQRIHICLTTLIFSAKIQQNNLRGVSSRAPSNLGNSSFNPLGAILYTQGCILTQMDVFPVFIGLYKWCTRKMEKNLNRSHADYRMRAAFAFTMIGVFSEDNGAPHTKWSSLFFFLNLIGLVLLGASLFTHPQHNKAIACRARAITAINLLSVLVSKTPILK